MFQAVICLNANIYVNPQPKKMSFQILAFYFLCRSTQEFQYNEAIRIFEFFFIFFVFKSIFKLLFDQLSLVGFEFKNCVIKQDSQQDVFII